MRIGLASGALSLGLSFGVVVVEADLQQSETLTASADCSPNAGRESAATTVFGLTHDSLGRGFVLLLIMAGALVLTHYAIKEILKFSKKVLKEWGEFVVWLRAWRASVWPKDPPKPPPSTSSATFPSGKTEEEDSVDKAA